MQILPSNLPLLGIASIAVTVLVLFVSSYNLYLSHFQETRSEISLMAQDGSKYAFDAGSATRWWTRVDLKIVNDGEKSGFIAAIDASAEGYRLDSELQTPDDIELDWETGGHVGVSTQIESHSANHYRPRITVETDEGPENLLQYDSLVVCHTMTIEDNQGSYEIGAATKIEMAGPSPAHDAVE